MILRKAKKPELDKILYIAPYLEQGMAQKYLSENDKNQNIWLLEDKKTL